MSTGVYIWSQTAATNASADSAINFAEGQAPSSVNDSARALMAAVAKWRDDNNGSLAGTLASSTYSVTSNQGTAGTIPDGFTIAFRPDTTNPSPVNLSVDSSTAHPIQATPGTNLPAALLTANSIYNVTYKSSATAWLLQDAPFLPTLAAVAYSGAAADLTGLATIATSGHASDATGTTTNDNAGAGKLGEVITSNVASGSAVSVTTAVAKTITSISLTAGDWDVWGWAATNPAGSTTTSKFSCGISTVDNDLGSFYTNLNGLSVSAGLTVNAPAATQRLSLSGSATVYLVGLANFAVSTCQMYGYITARRAR